MNRFGKSQPTVKSFQDRLGIAMLFVLVCFSILLLRFIWLQVFTQDDLEISRKLIVERKNLLRKKQLEYYKEKNEYIKFFENNLSG